jgi:hypothetical protein
MSDSGSANGPVSVGGSACGHPVEGVSVVRCVSLGTVKCRLPITLHWVV